MAILQFGITGIGDDVVLEVDDLLEIRGLHAQQCAEAARERFEEPDVHDWGCKIDMPHSLATHARVCHLDAAAVADDAFELRAFVLAARALVVAFGAKDAFAE